MLKINLVCFFLISLIFCFFAIKKTNKKEIILKNTTNKTKKEKNRNSTEIVSKKVAGLIFKDNDKEKFNLLSSETSTKNKISNNDKKQDIFQISCFFEDVSFHFYDKENSSPYKMEQELLKSEKQFMKLMEGPGRILYMIIATNQKFKLSKEKRRKFNVLMEELDFELEQVRLNLSSYILTERETRKKLKELNITYGDQLLNFLTLEEKMELLKINSTHFKSN